MSETPGVESILAEETTAGTEVTVEARGAFGVVGLAYYIAARRLGALLVPAVVLLVPLGSALIAVLAVVFTQDGLIVNGAPAIWPMSSRLAMAAAIVGAALMVVGFVLAVVATVVLVAGLQMGHALSTKSALQHTVRRYPGLGTGVVVALVVVAVTVAARAGLLAWISHEWVAPDRYAWLGQALIITVLAISLWILLSLPIAVLEDGGPFSAIGRAWRLTRWRRTSDTVALAVGVLVIPGVAVAGTWWALPPRSGLVDDAIGLVALSVVCALIVPFQAATLAVTTLNQWYPDHGRRGEPLDLHEIVQRPIRVHTAAHPRRRVFLIVLMALPGLLYAGYVGSNPFGLATTTDHVLAADYVDHVALQLPTEGHPIALATDSVGPSIMRICADRSCAVGRDQNLSNLTNREMGSVAMPDGSVLLAAWHMGVDLHLVQCAMSCEGLETAPVLDRRPRDGKAHSTFGTAAAMTTTPDGILIADTSFVNRTGVPGDTSLAWVRLTHCADAHCSKPRVTVVTIDRSALKFSDYHRPLAVAAGRDGDPVVALEDQSTGEVVVMRCRTVACAHPVVTRYGGGARIGDNSTDGISVAVPPDDHPVIAYRDVRTGAARLLRCRTPECAQADITALTGPGTERPWPALTLDPAGRPVVATYDLAHHNVVLISCDDLGCLRRKTVPVARVKSGPGPMDIKVDSAGRPQVLWADQGEIGESSLRLTTCLDPGCDA
ncbi:hypothetical protein [Actinomadura sp. HBU206391]|uniref:hypothetical protein n=1 Tax=Actinomadura sp. HBU206391 TaxID=2731692 RepID=UPI00164FD3AD|nr:hypothetical protein [Actinomadura sp. HBU206391]MBC6461580.1 hypothetical protein [Actinomadura sp. HBU206391]